MIHDFLLQIRILLYCFFKICLKTKQKNAQKGEKIWILS